MKPITDMTPEELRIACAEKCGWRNIKNNFGDAPFDKNFFGKLEIPDYEHDMNACMELTEKIWEKYKYTDSFIEKRIHVDELNNEMKTCRIYKILGRYDLDEDRYMLHVEANTLPVAIMRAFLIVMEDNE